MTWLSANWIWIALIGFMLWMHLGHRGMHGGMHGSQHGHDRQAHDDGDQHDHHGAATSTEVDSATTGHRHGGC